MIWDNSLRNPSGRTPGDPGAENVAEEFRRRAKRALIRRGESGPLVTLGSRDAGASSRGGVEGHARSAPKADADVTVRQGGRKQLDALLAGINPGPRETFIIARTLADAVSS